MLLPRTVLAFTALALLALPSLAGAQGRTTGSALATTPNYPYHCDHRWAAGYNGGPGFGPGGYQEYVPVQIGPSTCTLAQLGISGKPDTSHLVPGTGTVTVARVKSGPNPAPISIATVRSFQGRDGQGGMSSTCCRGVSETPTITPKPNAVTEIPVNFRVEATQFDPNTGKAGWHDWVVVNVHGTSGTLPIHNNGSPKPFFASATPAADDPQGMWYFPQIDPSVDNQNRWNAPGFEVLMNYDWCPATTAAAARAAQACPTQGSTGTPTPPVTTAPQTPGTPVAPRSAPRPGKPASVTASKLTLAGAKVGVRVRCAARPCAGKVSLRTLGRRARTLGTAKLRIGPGKTSTVKIALSARNRKRIGRRGLPVSVVVDLGSAGTVTSAATLRRAR